MPLTRYERSEGLTQIEGQVLREDTTMLHMCHELGFQVADDPGDSARRVTGHVALCQCQRSWGHASWCHTEA